MKKFIIGLLSLTTLTAIAYAGPEESSGKEIQQQVTSQPTQDFYQSREWNIDLFGAYAFPGNSYQADRYINKDHAWGGGIDADYFFNRYLGVGLEGYALNANDVLGQASGNLVFRYPIPNTRFAPYAYGGGGVIFNGSNAEDVISNGGSIASLRHRDDAEAMGQGGAGIEFRITPHIGLFNDFSWNIVDGPDNNYGMVRSGIRFAF
ncbi:MAG TPA: outer membrane beta-barrel protein [Chthoniobacterales bacterium]|nr:outer membrane beta-barrel protein [Chthoniobacterales bacterium]